MQKKRKVATMPVVMVVFFICLSAGIACGASDLESSYTSQGGFIPGQFRLTPFDYATGDFKTNSDRTFSYAEHYPFIRKTDLRGGYADSYRNPTSDNFDHGLSGRPVYLTDDGGELNGFIIPEIADVRAEKQIWEGNLTRYDFVRRPDMTVDRPKKWDLQSELNYFTNLQNLSTRNLSFWHRQNTGRDTSNARLVEHILDPQKQRPTGTAFNVEKMYGRGTQDDKTNYLLYPTNASNTNINLSALMGLATVGTDWKSDIKFPSTSNKFYVHPSHWMLAWMAGRDSRITNPGGFNKPNDGGARKMVPDLGQAVFGHIAHRDKRYVFAHTNDGLLHMIDDAAGNVSGSREVMAFMPPQVLYGKRLMQQKFDFRTSTSMTSARIGDNKLKTVVSANAWLPAGQAYPGFLTDGAVIARRLYTKSDGLKNVTHTGIYSKGTGSQNLKPHVFGLMGRGGAGMYLLRMDDYADTGEKDKLHLEWAMENDMYRYLSDTHEPVSTYLAATSLISGIDYNYHRDPANTYYNNQNYTPQDARNGMMGTMRFWLPNGDRDENLKKDYPLMNAPSNWDYTASRGLAGRETPTEKQHDHWRLGWNVPPPAVGMIEFKKSGETTASMVSTVVFISAGQQFFSDREKMGTFGSAVYVLSPVTGVGVWRRTAGNASNIGNIGTGRASVSGWPARNAPLGARDPVLGMMVTPPLAMYLGADQSPTPGEDYLRSVFTADHRGDIYEAGFCNERSDGTRGEPFAVLEGYDEEKGYVPHGPPNDFWSGDEPSYAEITFRRIGALRPEKGTDVTSCYAIPYQLTLQINGQNDIWLFGGTADLPTLQFSRVTGPRTGDEKKSGTLKNEKQYLFGLKRQPWNPNNLNSINLSNDIKIGRGNPVTSNGGTLYSTYEVAENSSTPVISWKLELGDNESVSSQPSLQVDPDTNKTYLYASTYVTKPAPHSRLYRLDPQTGAPTWKDEPSGGYYKNLGNIHVKGIDQVQLDGQQTTLVSYSDPNNLYTSEGKSLSDVFRDEGKKGEEIFSAPGLGGIFSLKDPPVDVKIESGQFFYWRRYNI